jgi:hypothetical protein
MTEFNDAVPCVKRPEHEADDSYPFSDEIEEQRKYIFALIYNFKAHGQC